MALVKWKKISWRMSSSKKEAFFPFWGILSRVNKKGRFIKASVEWKHCTENLKFKLSGDLLLNNVWALSRNIWCIFQKEQVKKILSLDHLNPQLLKIYTVNKAIIFMPFKRGCESIWATVLLLVHKYEIRKKCFWVNKNCLFVNHFNTMLTRLYLIKITHFEYWK